MPKEATYKARYNRYLPFWLSATRLPLLTRISTSRNRFAEGEGFEPPDCSSQPRVFKTRAIDLSANPPDSSISLVCRLEHFAKVRTTYKFDFGKKQETIYKPKVAV